MRIARTIIMMLAALLLPVLAFAQPAPQGETRTTFTVTKDFVDDNADASATVYIQCFTGLPLNQQQTIGDDGEVVFVVESYEDGKLDCNIWEGAVEGYSASYAADSYTTKEYYSDDEGCHFAEVGSQVYEKQQGPGFENQCIITNAPDPVEVTVNKDWEVAGQGGNQIDPAYSLLLVCESQITNGEDCTNPVLQGGSKGYGYYGSCYYYEGTWIKVLTDSGTGDTNDASYTAHVIPDWDGGTDCWVEEEVYDSSVEVDGYDCGYNGNPGLHVNIGGADGGGSEKDECTVTNTVFFEGIPTLNQYGMAILALLMLGAGFVGFRRFV